MLTLALFLLACWLALNWLSPLATLAAADPLSGGRVPAELLERARALRARFYVANLTRGPGFSAWVWPRYIIVLDRTFLSRLTPEHVRFVMAHELGHVALGHLRWRCLAMTSGAALLPLVRRRLEAHEAAADAYAELITGFKREHFDNSGRVVSQGGVNGRKSTGSS